jgi:hypothetical protein
VQHESEVRGAEQPGDAGGVGGVGDLGEACPPGLLRRLAGGAAPPGERLLRPVAPPHRDRAGRRPRHDPVDPDLGEQLDRELGPLALRQRLDHGQVRRCRLLDGDLAHGRGQVGLPGRDHLTGRPGARAVGDHDLLAHPDPAYDDRVPALGAVQPDGAAGTDGQSGRPEDRQRHRGDGQGAGLT